MMVFETILDLLLSATILSTLARRVNIPRATRPERSGLSPLLNVSAGSPGECPAQSALPLPALGISVSSSLSSQLRCPRNHPLAINPAVS
jgi:hypothetical protein